MKENSLARAGISRAEGEEKTISSLIVLCLTAAGDFRGRHIFLPARRPAPSLAQPDDIHFQPVPAPSVLPRLARRTLLSKK